MHSPAAPTPERPAPACSRRGLPGRARCCRPCRPAASPARRSHERAESIGAASDQLFPVGGITETQTLNFNVSWELDFFGRLQQARRVANADFAATRFDVEGARATLAASVADNYFQAKGLAIQLADADTNASISQKLYDIAQEKARLGLGAASDADQAAGELALAQAQVGRSRRPIPCRPAPAADPGGARNSSPRPAFRPPPRRRTRRRCRRPFPAICSPAAPMSGRRKRSSPAKSVAKLLKHLAVFPTFTLLPGLGLSRTVAPGVVFIPPATLLPAQQTTSLSFWTLAGGVSQPVLDIPHLLQDAKAEDARTEQAVIAYEKVVQTAYGEAENALAGTGGRSRAAWSSCRTANCAPGAPTTPPRNATHAASTTSPPRSPPRNPGATPAPP